MPKPRATHETKVSAAISPLWRDWTSAREYLRRAKDVSAETKTDPRRTAKTAQKCSYATDVTVELTVFTIWRYCQIFGPSGKQPMIVYKTIVTICFCILACACFLLAGRLLLKSQRFPLDGHSVISIYLYSDAPCQNVVTEFPIIGFFFSWSENIMPFCLYPNVWNPYGGFLKWETRLALKKSRILDYERTDTYITLNLSPSNYKV